MLPSWEKARHGDSVERWNMQKSTQQTEKLSSRECKRKVNREGQETKVITLETKYNKLNQVGGLKCMINKKPVYNANDQIQTVYHAIGHTSKKIVKGCLTTCFLRIDFITLNAW